MKEVRYRDTIKTIASGVENAGIYQSIALILFILFFIVLVYLIVSRPKNYYTKIDKLPLED